MGTKILTAGVLSCILAAGCSSSNNATTSTSEIVNDLAGLEKVLVTNADIAFASYSDAVTTAQELKTALSTHETNQNAESLEAAKKAWLVAREPYGQTEVYRFRNSPIDDDPATAAAGDGPEGTLNAWPLGESLIDYIQATTSDFGDDQVGVSAHSVAEVNNGNAITAAYAKENTSDNIIGSNVLINDALLELSTSADDEHDVISGYHSIEFLLWGQDLNNTGVETTGVNDRNLAIKTHDASARATGGERPLTDFNTSNGCTSAGASAAASVCQRRHDFLEVVVDKLIAELIFVRDHWKPAVAGNYRSTFVAPANLATAESRLLEILTGMGTLSEGELAGERMQISLSANSQEDEHSCFSDNTHRDIWLNAEGIANMFNGKYNGYDSNLDGTDDAGTVVDGFGIDDYLAQVGANALSTDVAAALAITETNYTAIDTAARAGTPVDVMIQDAAGDNAKPMRDTILSLNAQSTLIAKIATDLKVGSAAAVVDSEASGCDTTDPTSSC